MFVKTKYGFSNLKFVENIIVDDQENWKLVAPDGGTIGIVAYYDAPDLTQSVYPISPAVPGSFAYHVHAVVAENGETEIVVDRPIIVGWRIIDRGAEPIVFCIRCSGDFLGIQEGNGQIRTEVDELFPNLDDFIAFATERLQAKK